MRRWLGEGLGLMLNGLCKSGNIEECFELWKKMGKCGLRNVRSYNIFL